MDWASFFWGYAVGLATMLALFYLGWVILGWVIEWEQREDAEGDDDKDVCSDPTACSPIPHEHPADSDPNTGLMLNIPPSGVDICSREHYEQVFGAVKPNIPIALSVDKGSEHGWVDCKPRAIDPEEFRKHYLDDSLTKPTPPLPDCSVHPLPADAVSFKLKPEEELPYG